MSKVTVMDHPLIIHKMSLIRDKKTGSKDFRELVKEISMLMCYEATRDLKLKEVEIETKNSSGQSTGFEKREIEVNYYIWYKELD